MANRLVISEVDDVSTVLFNTTPTARLSSAGLKHGVIMQHFAHIPEKSFIKLIEKYATA